MKTSFSLAWFPVFALLAFESHAQNNTFNPVPPRPRVVFPQANASADDAWVLYSNYTHSDLSNEHASWQQFDTEVYYIPNKRWHLMGSASHRTRERQSDTVYGLTGSYQATPRLELHGSLHTTPGADFTYRSRYEAGMEYQAASRLDLLLDARKYHYAEGSINEIRPGARIHATDVTAITARYTSGRAFGERDYDGWSVRMDHRFKNKHRISVSYAKGTDPEMLPTSSRVLLSDSETMAVGYRFPIKETIDMTLGVEHEKRPGVYSRTGVSAGVVVRF